MAKKREEWCGRWLCGFATLGGSLLLRRAVTVRCFERLVDIDAIIKEILASFALIA
jgi:hypothetical protein